MGQLKRGYKVLYCRIDANVYLQTFAVSVDKYSRSSLIYGHQRDKANCPYHRGRGCMKFVGAFGPSRTVLNMEVSVRHLYSCRKTSLFPVCLWGMENQMIVWAIC